MEDKEEIEYKKRVKELIEQVEKNKDKDKDKNTYVGEQQLKELMHQRLLQFVKSKIHPDFRNEDVSQSKTKKI